MSRRTREASAAMTPTSSDSSALFATDHGSIEWATEGRLRLRLGARTWALAPNDVVALHESTQPLAAQVYRCNCDCRWQLRLEGHEAVVLGSEEVLRLHSLLDGAVAMLELGAILDDAAIGRPAEMNGR